jgi:anaerobic ribonucleoside-triphosphate reductase activating protein
MSVSYVDGSTLSGGDPFYIGNRDKIGEICKTLKEKFPNKTIWCYTGYVYDQVKDLEAMKYIDVLVDGPFIIEKKNPSRCDFCNICRDHFIIHGKYFCRNQ